MGEGDDAVPREVIQEAARLARLEGNPYLQGTDGVRRRVSKMTPARKRKFCELIAKGQSPTTAAKALGVARTTPYNQKSIDPDFAEAWQGALEHQTDLVEEALFTNATQSRNVAAQIFTLKNRRPDDWRDKREVSVDRPTGNIPEVTEGAARQALLDLAARVGQRFLEGKVPQPPQGGGYILVAEEHVGEQAESD